MEAKIFKQCQTLFPEWINATKDDFVFDAPKGFSSFTMGIRAKIDISPKAILYRQLEGKENAILDYDTEKEVFLTLGENKIAAFCPYYDEHCRYETFYQGRSLREEDLFIPDNLRQIANQLYKFHQLSPPSLPQTSFFDLLHKKWGKIAKNVLDNNTHVFPENEQQMCQELKSIYSQETFEKVKRCIPEGPLTFCHNDTYHGNIMILNTGEIKLVDFEFSCLNNKAYDFSNLFAETVMKHKQPDYPYFKIATPEFGDKELGTLINFYLDNAEFDSTDDRAKEYERLLQNTKDLILLSHYKYAMAALPLAIDPIQKIRFIPYAYQRYNKFLEMYNERFG